VELEQNNSQLIWQNHCYILGFRTSRIASRLRIDDLAQICYNLVSRRSNDYGVSASLIRVFCNKAYAATLSVIRPGPAKKQNTKSEESCSSCSRKVDSTNAQPR